MTFSIQPKKKKKKTFSKIKEILKWFIVYVYRKEKKGLKWRIELHIHPDNDCNPLIFYYKFFFFLILFLFYLHTFCLPMRAPKSKKKKKKKNLELKDKHTDR